MAPVEWSDEAARRLDQLTRTYSLPADTKERVKTSLRPLERLPFLGPELGGRYRDLRFVLGPWRWLILLYVYLEPDDRVVVVTVEDARSATAPRT